MAVKTSSRSKPDSAGLSRPGQIALLAGVALAYSAVAVATEPWNWYSRVFTAIPGFAAVWYAVKRGWHRSAEERSAFRVDGPGAMSLMVWTLLVTLTASWVLAIFFSHPREVYPTLSHLMNIVFENYPLRVGGFFAWLALGWYLLRRR